MFDLQGCSPVIIYLFMDLQLRYFVDVKFEKYTSL